MDYDVIVIGGGITGAGLLRDLSLRGLKALLVEKGRVGGATTAASTHLIHGGLRYLLYDRLTTLTTCRDSGHIVRIARPLLTRLPILWPVYRGHRRGLEMVETLMEAYGPLSRLKEGLPHLRMSASETLRLVPGLGPEGLLGALCFDEWWVDAAGLAAANVASASRHGAEWKAGSAVVGLLLEGRRVVGARLQGPDGKLSDVRASCVANAAGPWADRIARLAGARVPMRLQKGSHLVYDSLPAALTSRRPLGLLLEARDRERYVFLVLTASRALLGPTDLPCSPDPDRLRTDESETRYLLDSARRYFPAFPEGYDRSVVGARPILAQKGSEKLLSREYEAIDHEARDDVAGFVSVAGGKMSDFRLMAEEAADLVCRKLNRPRPCDSASWTLNGEPLEPPGPPGRARRPWTPFKRLLRRHPRLREVHALAHLGGAWVRHSLRRAAGVRSESALETFDAHYGRACLPHGEESSRGG